MPPPKLSPSCPRLSESLLIAYKQTRYETRFPHTGISQLAARSQLTSFNHASCTLKLCSILANASDICCILPICTPSVSTVPLERYGSGSSVNST
jgi:hypothetical protein